MKRLRECEDIVKQKESKLIGEAMKYTWLWRTLVLCGLGIGAWALNSVADMPKDYTSKEEFNELRKENREDHKEILNQIQKLHRR